MYFQMYLRYFAGGSRLLQRGSQSEDMVLGVCVFLLRGLGACYPRKIYALVLYEAQNY